MPGLLMIDPRVAYLQECASEGIVEIGSFTDEELAVIEDPAYKALTPLPWLENQPKASWDALCTAALRGLVARGIVDPSRDTVSNGGLALGLPDEVAALLALRQDSEVVLLAEQVQAPQTQRFCALFPAGSHEGISLAIEEDISPRGLHSFRMGAQGTMLARLARFTAPEDVPEPNEHRSSWRLTEQQFAAGQLGELMTATCVTGFELRASRSDCVEKERVAVYVLPDRMLTSQPDGDDLLVSSATMESIVGILSGILGASAGVH